MIQAVALAEFDGLTQPNAYGHIPLHNNDPTQPDDDYFAHVDWIVEAREALGPVRRLPADMGRQMEPAARRGTGDLHT